MRPSTIVFAEFGMLIGILVVGYMLPGTTSLLTFLLASGACLAGGNLLLFRKIKQFKSGDSILRSNAWTHIFKGLTILAVFWLLSLVLSRR